MIELALMRHGPTQWTDQGRLQGRRDEPLNEQGRAAVLEWKLPGWVSARQWYTSPLLRAYQTAHLLGEQFGGQNIVTEHRLIEMDWALWEGETLVELRQKNASAMSANEARGLDFRPEGGESPRELMDRVQPWLIEVGASSKAAFAVTHKGVIRAIIAKATGWNMTGKPPVKIKWGTLHIFEVGPEGNLAMKDVIETAVALT